MELETRYDSRASFYGKARTETTRNDYETTIDLYSYDTLVASIIWNYDKHTTTYKYLGHFSQTTTRHQKEFFKQHELSDKEIKELFAKGELVEEW
jgi:adenine-specific DNA methylase